MGGVRCELKKKNERIDIMHWQAVNERKKIKQGHGPWLAIQNAIYANYGSKEKVDGEEGKYTSCKK